jgi:hypothetical protein
MSSVALDDIQVDFSPGNPAVGRKALAYPGQKRICIDPAFWRSLRTVDARAAILAHERGHIEGARCESCADFRAGEILRAEGTATPRDAARAMAGRLENRDANAAASDLLEGFGLDEALSGAGYLLNASRADGVVAPKVRAFLERLHREGLTFNGVTYSVTVGVDGGRRTDEALQARLYAQGREQNADGSWRVVNQGLVVTNARTLAQTKHGSGKAVDLWVVLPSGVPLLNKSQAPATFDALYEALGALGESMGLTWGGRWKTLTDRPHFEDSAYVTPATMAAGVALLFLVVVAVTLVK